MESEALLCRRYEKFERFQALAATPCGRTSLFIYREKLKMLIRQEEVPLDNPLSAALCDLEGGTTAWDFAVISNILVEHKDYKDNEN
ncbi:MAG: hypothetical protein Q8L37_04460 [Candidatus Gottesmanbacteria bacterium]|nr:hypothetical protein [Candidatus Gottesmanbacteria bacterium]